MLTLSRQYFWVPADKLVSMYNEPTSGSASAWWWTSVDLLCCWGTLPSLLLSHLGGHVWQKMSMSLMVTTSQANLSEFLYIWNQIAFISWLLMASGSNSLPPPPPNMLLRSDAVTVPSLFPSYVYPGTTQII